MTSLNPLLPVSGIRNGGRVAGTPRESHRARPCLVPLLVPLRSGLRSVNGDWLISRRLSSAFASIGYRWTRGRCGPRGNSADRRTPVDPHRLPGCTEPARRSGRLHLTRSGHLGCFLPGPADCISRACDPNLRTNLPSGSARPLSVPGHFHRCSRGDPGFLVPVLTPRFRMDYDPDREDVQV